MSKLSVSPSETDHREHFRSRAKSVEETRKCPLERFLSGRERERERERGGGEGEREREKEGERGGEGGGERERERGKKQNSRKRMNHTCR